MGDSRQAVNGPGSQVYREVQPGAGSARLVTEVFQSGLRVWFEPIHATPHCIRFTDIERVVVTRALPTMQFGGSWGIDIPEFNAMNVYRLSAEAGVLLDLVEGSQLFIGSTNPSELRQAIVSTADLEDTAGP